MIHRQDLRIRDPFILSHGGVYYLCGSGEEKSLPLYRSTDLEEFEELPAIFTIEEDSWAEKDTWAAEIHAYMGKFYLFVSLLGKNGLRGTQVAVSDTPDGRYRPVKNAPITPESQSCIDATLFVDGDTPYIAYSHDWPDNYLPEEGVHVGEIWAAEVTRDLSDIVGEPFLLFTSREAPLSAAAPNELFFEGEYARIFGEHVIRFGSDAPFVQRLSSGALYLTWSPMLENNYVILSALSESGSIRGPWRHLDTPLYAENGGHAMFFTDLDGTRRACFHAPECAPHERATFKTVAEEAGVLRLL